MDMIEEVFERYERNQRDLSAVAFMMNRADKALDRNDLTPEETRQFKEEAEYWDRRVGELIKEEVEIDFEMTDLEWIFYNFYCYYAGTNNPNARAIIPDPPTRGLIEYHNIDVEKEYRAMGE